MEAPSSPSPEAAQSGLSLTKNRHAKFLQRSLQVLPCTLTCFDLQRVTLAYFAISGLDVLDSLDLVKEQRQEIIDWLYHCLICPASPEDATKEEVLQVSGFRGSPALKLSATSLPSHPHDHGHIAMTYTALASLVILGDDLSRLNRSAVVEGVRALQLEDGSFRAALEGGENDMRFLYCAAAICHMLGDWRGVARAAALEYVIASFSYEGGIGQGPGLEAHGGSTYCGVAALSLMGLLQDLGPARLAALERWCLGRQGRQEDRCGGRGAGFQGRPNKPEDTCYSFWVGATLALLDRLGLCELEESRQFVLSTQDPVTGGLSKWTDTQADPLHTYLGLTGLAIGGKDNLQPVDPALNITQRAKHFLCQLQTSWK